MKAKAKIVLSVFMALVLSVGVYLPYVGNVSAATLNHAHNTEYEEVVSFYLPPTCTQDGYTQSTSIIQIQTAKTKSKKTVGLFLHTAIIMN